MTDTTRVKTDGYAGLVDGLARRGLLSARWREVWEKLPRDRFIPHHAWRQDQERCVPVVRGPDWWDLVHSDQPVVTQVDDGQPDGPGVATSSNSQPSMVARMLQLLDVRDGDRVLEIGTATGYVAALLSERLGSDRVVSVEIDAALSQQAADTLADHGLSPRLVVGDGAEGWAEDAPYDRLISTCALRHIPHALVRQVAPGGIVVAPLARAFWSGALVRLSVQDGGIARGPFRGGASYMPMRSHRLPDAGPVDSGTARSSEAVTDPGQLLNLGFALYAGARLPGVTMSHAETGTAATVWLQDTTGSAAVAATGESVWEYGERNLWAEVEAVYAEYAALGQPDGDSFGLTVTPSGQEVWLRSPRTVIAAA
ncbi:methyltransferase domain-containing protein [Streptomyces sp. NBC_01317]|uniref:methyltransferase domain-containing protein n=1 Tax=Streptomyces sp. NBC_01317 TaxID=2903822 RepID=UPI002E107900|nr:methyltransferase domain-containing protein [Streptomyces sp. NBC_01317]